jgi:hypothetical protein
MRKHKIRILLLAIVFGLGVIAGYPALAATGSKKSKAASASKKRTGQGQKKPALAPGRVGETIVYGVRLGMVTIGRATFHHVSRSVIDGKPTDLFTFETKVTNFHDMERIYSDAKNHLPLKVVRKINNVIGQEDIIENYDQINYTLTVTKIKGKKTEQAVIKKKKAIHNAVLMPFYVRRIPVLNAGWTQDAEFPTQSFTIKLVGTERVSVPAGKFDTYHFHSVPAKFEIWITKDARRIPVKIKGSGPLGYVMVMREYH